MSAAAILAAFWAAAAAGWGFAPARWRWGLSCALVAAGIPLLGLVTWLHGPVWGFALLAAGISLLRWPPAREGGWLRRLAGERT